MNDIGIFICNYNGKEWVVKCIESLLEQTFQEFDIHVVDNASTDGTVKYLSEKYGKKIIILCNPKNLGGAGGFNKALKTSLKKGYKYTVLLDNDVVLDKNVIKNMSDFMNSHEKTGIVGAKVMIMDKPDTIQDYGNYLDFSKFREINGYQQKKDSESIPEVNECTYVPTCAVMVRTELLKKSGTMPADNFIYYDDIELSYKMGLQGYKVVALGSAKVWHKGGFWKGMVSTSTKYYFLRNRLHFFAKYIPEEKTDEFVETILSEIIPQLYGYYNKGMMELFQTTIYALDDFLHGVRGKAEEFKIMQILGTSTPFENVISGKKRIRIIFTDNFHPNDPLDIYHIFLYIVTNIQNRCPQKTIWVSLGECSYYESDFDRLLKKTIEMDKPNFELPEIVIQKADEGTFDLNLRICEHVKLVEKPALPEIYVDKYCNCITSEEDYAYFKSYPVYEKIFLEIYRPLMRQAVKKIRDKVVENE